MMGEWWRRQRWWWWWRWWPRWTFYSFMNKLFPWKKRTNYRHNTNILLCSVQLAWYILSINGWTDGLSFCNQLESYDHEDHPIAGKFVRLIIHVCCDRSRIMHDPVSEVKVIYLISSVGGKFVKSPHLLDPNHWHGWVVNQTRHLSF